MSTDNHTKQQGAAAKHQKHKSRKDKPVLAQVEIGAGAGNSKFARALGSTDFVTREKGLQALLQWMCLKKSEISELDMMKIWKGLFFCFWHSDKAPVQVRAAECWLLEPCTIWSCRVIRVSLDAPGANLEYSCHEVTSLSQLMYVPTPPHHTHPSNNPQADLAQRLASMLPQLPPPTARLYFGCFLATMRREWFAIDYHRLDKFLMLVRRFVVAMMGLLQDSDW